MGNYNNLQQGHGEEPHAGALYDSSTLINVSKEGRIASIVAGALLTTSAIKGIDRHPLRSLFRLAAGGYLLYRGISGNCPVSAMTGKRLADRHAKAINIRTKLVVNKPRWEVYSFWRQLSNLPLFMQHLESVIEQSTNRSHWVAKGPGNIGTVEWDAEIVKEEPGSLLGWRSVTGSEIATAGRVNFSDAIGGGTEIQLMITYRPPAGYVGAGLAWLLNPAFSEMVRKDVLRFKEYLESGKVSS